MNILFPYMARWSSVHASRYYHLLTKVAELGHYVYVIQPPSRGSMEANDIDVLLQSHPNINIETLRINERFWRSSFPLEKLIKKFYFTLKSKQLVKEYIAAKNIDLLYIYNLPQSIYLIGPRPTAVFDFADDLLGMLQTELSISNKHPVYYFADKWLQWIINRVDLVICISSPLYNLVQHQHKFIIPNGANLPTHDCNNTSNLDEKNRTTTVGYVGAFEAYMALELAIDAAERVPDVQFLFVGSGRNFARINSLVESRKLHNVTFKGPLAHDAAMEMIDRMDICLNLFHKSRVTDAVSPLKLFEYLVKRKPVISTRLQEVERINQDFIFFADNVNEIVDSINYIITHKDEVNKRVERGYSVVTQNFTWSKIANDFISAVQSVNRSVM